MYHQDCEYDSLAVTSKMGSEEARNHGLYCGNKLPPVSGMVTTLVKTMVMMMVKMIVKMMVTMMVTLNGHSDGHQFGI